MDRKKFILIFTRTLILAAITAMTGLFIFKNNKGEGKLACNISPACKSCKQLSSCTKPEAIEYAQNSNNQNSGQNGK